MPYRIFRWFLFAFLRGSNPAFSMLSFFVKWTSFTREFSKTCPLFLFSWSHFTLWSNRFCSLSQATSITISVLLCLARYSLRPAKRTCFVSHFPLRNLHWLFSVSHMTSFQALLSVICSIIDLIDIFLDDKFFSSSILHFFVYFTLHARSVELFESLFLTTFFEGFFYFFPYWFEISVSICPANLISSPSNFNVLPFIYIFNKILSLIELLSFLVSYFQATLIHLLSDTNILHVILLFHKLLSVI